LRGVIFRKYFFTQLCPFFRTPCSKKKEIIVKNSLLKKWLSNQIKIYPADGLNEYQQDKCLTAIGAKWDNVLGE